MTAIISKPAQKRLDRCVLARPKWAEIHEKQGQYVCDARKNDDLAPDVAVRVENAQQNRQARRNNKLLGKYRVMTYVQANDSAWQEIQSEREKLKN